MRRGWPRRIAATIVVEREPHLAMIIGSGGERLKCIAPGPAQLEHLFDAKVFLESGQGARRLADTRRTCALRLW
jgi:GTPase Era involved in 16S rRNA processing